MSKLDHPESTVPIETPAFLPEPEEGVGVQFRDDAVYRAGLDLIRAEDSVLLILADLFADHELVWRMKRIGQADRALGIAQALDMEREIIMAQQREENGVVVTYLGTSEYAIRHKQCRIEGAYLWLVHHLLADAEMGRLLFEKKRQSFTRRLGHLRNGILIAHKEASGVYAMVLEDLRLQPPKRSAWEA